MGRSQERAGSEPQLSQDVQNEVDVQQQSLSSGNLAPDYMLSSLDQAQAQALPQETVVIQESQETPVTRPEPEPEPVVRRSGRVTKAPVRLDIFHGSKSKSYDA